MVEKHLQSLRSTWVTTHIWRSSLTDITSNTTNETPTRRTGENPAWQKRSEDGLLGLVSSIRAFSSKLYRSTLKASHHRGLTVSNSGSSRAIDVSAVDISGSASPPASRSGLIPTQSMDSAALFNARHSCQAQKLFSPKAVNTLL